MSPSAAARLADLVVVVHAAFVAFVVTGGLLAWRWPRVAFAHIPAALWGAWIELTRGVCPLTPLENALRRHAGQGGYAGGFIEHWIERVLYPGGLSPAVQTALGVGVLVLNLAIYGALAARRRRRASRAS
jgi:hypothetical protein